MKKRLCACLLVLCLALTLFSETTTASTVITINSPSNGVTEDSQQTKSTGTHTIKVTYPVTGGNIYFNTETGAITGCEKSVTEAVIPNEINGVAVTSIEHVPGELDVFFECSNLTSVTIPDSVTKIEDSVFSDCSSLTSINVASENLYYSSADGVLFNAGKTLIHTYPAGKNSVSYSIPDSVNSIGSAAFKGCSSLSSVSIPGSVTDFGNYAFTDCSSLTNVVISNGVTSIGDGAFKGCINLSSLTIPGSVTSMGLWVFEGGNSITSAGPIGGGYDYEFGWTEDIPNSAFEYCNGLTSVAIPDSITSIGVNAFAECRSLTSATIPAKVTNVGECAFYGCSNLSSINVANGNSNYVSVDGVLFNANKTLLHSYPAKKSDLSYIIPNSVTSIGSGAFSACSSLSSVIIPDGVTCIKWGTFVDCSNLSSVTVPTSVTNVEAVAFSGSNNLTDIYYKGSESMWKEIVGSSGNDPWYNARKHFNSEETPTPDNRTISLTEGVKYVPYLCVADAEKEYAYGIYELEGTLPSGLSLNPETSVISGTPMASGTWEFRIKRTFGENTLEIPLTLTILDNTDRAVQQQSNDYPILEPVGTPDPQDPNHFYKDKYSDETLIIDAPYSEFYRVMIDGQKLREPDDYTSKEGSTVITIHAETFQRFGEGTHTIAAEFKPADATVSPVKRVAQNYTVKLSQSSPQSPQLQKKEMPFTDIIPADWFYEDVIWAYQEGLMQGVGGNRFDPKGTVSQATIVTVLARIAKIDLTSFDGETEPGFSNGQYFTTAAIWAKRAGLLPKDSAFTGNKTTTRNQMAVMLTKYLTSMGKDTTPPAQPVTFGDLAEMSQEGATAFQTLYQYGIFKGMGGMKMEPNGSTTRAQFAALMHRIYGTAVS